MSATIDQPIDQTSNPGPSSPNTTIGLGCSNDEHLLAASSDEETDATQEDDLPALLSESEEEKESPVINRGRLYCLTFEKKSLRIEMRTFVLHYLVEKVFVIVRAYTYTALKISKWL